MDEFFKEFVTLLANGGWLTVAALFMYLSYKTSIVGMIALAIYKALKLVLTRHATFEQRVARALETTVPLTVGEEGLVLELIRANKK